MISHSFTRCFLSVLALATALAPTGCIGGAGEPLEDDEGVATDSEAIINGTSYSATYPEAAAIAGSGGTLPSGTSVLCSATLISPRVVLTAGHCVDGMTSWDVNVGAQWRTTTRAATFDWKDGASSNPAHHDIGLLFLNQAISIAVYPTIAQAMVPASSQVITVGRIHSGVLTSTAWGAVSTPLTDGASVSRPFDYASPNVLEAGDAGGPNFLLGTHTIVAVNRAKSSSGTTEYLARVDLLAAWINQPVDDSSFFVKQVYLDVLGREADDAGLAWWVSALQSCNGASACVASTRVALARGFLESAEARAKYPDLNPASAGYKGAYVTHCFTSFLQRQPDSAGYNYWLNYLNSTSDYNGVTSGFITSPEYRSRFGAP